MRGVFDQGERTVGARYVTPKMVTAFVGAYFFLYYFKYNLGVSAHLLQVLAVRVHGQIIVTKMAYK